MNNNALYAGERRQIKYNESPFRSPSYYNLSYEENFIRTQDGIMIHTWFIKQHDKESTVKAPTLIYFHGNAGSKYTTTI